MWLLMLVVTNLMAELVHQTISNEEVVVMIRVEVVVMIRVALAHPASPPSGGGGEGSFGLGKVRCLCEWEGMVALRVVLRGPMYERIRERGCGRRYDHERDHERDQERERDRERDRGENPRAASR